jgi:hypothetical protein
MSHQLDEKRKEHLSNAKSLNADIEQFQSIIQIFHRKKDETYLWKLKIKRSIQMLLFLARRKNNAVPNAKNSVQIDKPRKVYKRTKENEAARKDVSDIDTYLKAAS